MDHTHPDAFLDWPEPSTNSDSEIYTKPCPLCKAHGGWNLKLNAYSLHGLENTSENRHKYSHFRACCSHCSGYGFVRKDETCNGHEWSHDANLGRCYNRYVCIHCGIKTEIDSSD